MVHSDPAKEALCEQIRRAGSRPFALRRGETEQEKPRLIPQISDRDLVAVAENAEHLEVIRALAPNL